MLDVKLIKRFRLLHDFTQKEVAEKIGLKQNAYCIKEKGKVKFSLEEAMKLAQLYNVKIEDFFSK